MYVLIWSNSVGAWFGKNTTYTTEREKAQHYEIDVAMDICIVEEGETGFDRPILSMIPVTETEFQRIEGLD